MSSPAMETEAERKKAQEIGQLLQNPSAFLQPSSMGTTDKGGSGHSNQLVRIAVLNRSRYAVSDVQGRTDWFGSDGASLGSTTFNLTGTIPASTTKVFTTADHSLTGTTIEGTSGTMRVTFTHVEVIE